jgi:IclR family transcriptional regulator, KDG regulon repressor
LSEIQSLARGLRTMELMAASEDGVGITELADSLGIDKSSASRLVQTLVNYGFAEQVVVSRRYKLGPQVVRLSRSLLTRMPLRDEAKPFLRQLVDQTGECAHLAILTQGQALYIDQVESPASLRVTTGVGTLAPLHCTALGKCLMAFSPDVPLPKDLPAFTPRTITDTKTLSAHLEQTRQRGYAVDDEEYDYGVRCVAAPVFDFRGKVIGAIGISGPAGRMGLDKITDVGSIVMQASQALSDRMSFTRA